jgi:hypothetical protein
MMLPLSFHVRVRTQASAEAEPEIVDLTDSEISAPVYDDGVQVGSLTVEKDDAVNGRVKVTIPPEIYDAVGRYSTWRFHEDTTFDFPLIEQRLVKS